MLVTFCSPIPLPVVSVLMIKRSHLTEHAYWGIVWIMRPHLFPSGLKTAALEMCVDLEMLPEPTCPPSGPSRRRRRTWRRWRRRSCRTWTALFLLHHKGRTRTSQGACGLTTNQIYLSICLSNYLSIDLSIDLSLHLSISISIYIHTHIYTYTHTHTHTKYKFIIKKPNEWTGDHCRNIWGLTYGLFSAHSWPP